MAAQGIESPAGGLLTALTSPNSVAGLSTDEWTLLLRQARRARVLSRLALDSKRCGIIERLPAKVREHLDAGAAVAASHDRALLWEIDQVARALRELDVPILLLKGAAYLAANLPPARGRLASDLDIMVPEATLAAVEHALRQHGWAEPKLDPYDQRYYRTWMHELPPLRHQERHTIVDVHHTILPRTSRLRPDPHKLWAAAQPLDGVRLYTPAPTDMVLHSATHLLQDSDLHMAIRDLVDISDLLQHFGRHAGFWDRLVPRAVELDLARPLYYALRYARRLLGTPMPPEVVQAAQAAAPSAAVLAAMDRLVPLVLLPDDPDRPSRRSAYAALLLVVRSHWLRMPPGLLALHLARKALKRLRVPQDGEA